MNSQKNTARTIVERGADYVFARKGNHPQLHQDVIKWFAWAKERDFRGVSHDSHQTVNKGHGRLEIRHCWVIHDPLALESMGHYEGWPGLRTVARVVRERHIGGHLQTETAYYLSSLPPDARRLLAATRAHWSVENTFHWTMNVVFGEDAARMRLDEAAENFAVTRHLAFNLLKQQPAKLSTNPNAFALLSTMPIYSSS